MASNNASARGGAASSGVATATRSIETGVTYFSAAEIDVVLVPVGSLAQFERYSSIVTRFRQVLMSNVHSFYRAAQKSPFKHYPWKSGTMQFRFLTEEAALRPRPLGCLHASRTVKACIGIHVCSSDSEAVLDEFEDKIRGTADLVRCFAFDSGDGDDEKGKQKLKKRPSVVLLPPAREHLSSHMEIVMHDFAASMLNVLEQKILTVSPQTISLESYVDSAAFLGSGLSAVVFSTEDEASRTKRKYGRVQKAMGDYALLSGSPLDALDHYTTAMELGRASQDWVYVAASLEGIITSKMLHEATSRDAFPPSQESVFQDEGRWRAEDATGTESATVASSMDPFEQRRFWETLQGCDQLMEEISSLLDECKAAIRKRSALPLLVESELRYARLLAGLKGPESRAKVCKLVASVQRAAEILPLPEDRLVALMEAANVLGSVGASRKRVLLLWQVVELSKYFGFPEEKSLAVARQALADSSTHGKDHSEWDVFKRPLSQETNIPDSWGMVKAGILEATLGLAIYANRHADVWDAAAALLRDHSAILSSHRIRSLYDNLKAASSNMPTADKVRPGRGPPPVVYLVGPEALKGERSVFVMKDTDEARHGRESDSTADTTTNPFLYDAFASKRKERNSTQPPSQETCESGRPTEWIRGEAGRIDLELYNASPLTMKIARLVVLATIDGKPASKTEWRPKVVSLTVPPTSRPVKITLEATPLVEGEFVLTGCRMTSSEGISWMAPWSDRPLGQVRVLRDELRQETHADHRPMLRSLPALPLAVLKHKDERGSGEPADNNASDDGRPDVEVVSGRASECVLVLTNLGSVAVERASLSVRAKRASPHVNVSFPTNPLASNPLAPGASVEIPVAFSVEMAPLGVGRAPAVETASFEFCIEYAGESHLGRRTICPLNLAISPSIELSGVSIKAVYGPERCLLLASVVNRAATGLRAALAAIAADGSKDTREASRGQEIFIQSGERCDLALALSAETVSQMHVVLFGTTELDGSCVLPPESIHACLTPETVSAIRPCELKASIALEGLETKHIALDEHGNPAEAHERATGFPVAHARVGDSFGVTIHLHSDVDSPCFALYTVRAEKVTLRPAGGSPAYILPVTEEGWDEGGDRDALDLGFAWHGVAQNAMIEVGPKGTATWTLSLSCWTPGWFKLALSDVRILDAADSFTPSASFARVLPAFIRIE